jgi:hypothetical protein
LSDPRAIAQRATLNRGIDKGATIANNTSATSPEINNLFSILESVRTRVTPEEFHKFMGKNELYLFPILKPFGYLGSRARAEGTIKDFDRAFFNRQGKIRDISSLTRITTTFPPTPPYDKYFRQKMWESAANDPIAAAVIGSGAAISSTVGALFGFEQDPEKAAGAGEGISNLAHAAGSLYSPHPVNEMVSAESEKEDRMREENEIEQRIREAAERKVRISEERIREVRTRQDRLREERVRNQEIHDSWQPAEGPKITSEGTELDLEIERLRGVESRMVKERIEALQTLKKVGKSSPKATSTPPSSTPPSSTPPSSTPPSPTIHPAGTAGTGGIDTISAKRYSDGTTYVTITGKLLQGLERGAPTTPNFNKDLPSGKDIDLIDYEVAHLWGPGFGDEAFDGMMYAPKEVNQIWQNKKIETRLRQLRDLAASEGATIQLSASAESYPLETWRGHQILKEVTYHFEIKFSDGRPSELIAEVNIEIPSPKMENGKGKVSGKPIPSVRGGSAVDWVLDLAHH